MSAPTKTLTPSSKSQRGLNKPKCFVCGNVARSRCPYQSCKGCCSKAQNPCHIHVLKANPALSEKPPTSGNAASDQQPSKSSETPSSGSSLRVASLRQLSSNFAQFNNINVPFRSKKPVTRKEAEAINKWRFSRLKESKDRDIEAENEAFDRYMQNVSLLEDSFLVKSLSGGSIEDASSVWKLNPSSENNIGKMTAALKLNFRSNVVRTENYKKRIQKKVNEGLNELLKSESVNMMEDQSDKEETYERLKKPKLRKLKASEICDLNDKLSKIRNAEDLKSCIELKSKLFDQHFCFNKKETGDPEPLVEEIARDQQMLEKELFLLSQPLKTSEIDPETLVTIDSHFCSLEQIEDL